MAAFELILRRPNRPDKICYRNDDGAEIGDVLDVDGRAWLVIEKHPPFAQRRIERIVCVPRTVRSY